MLLFDAPLTFQEFMADEELPLATVFRETLKFLAGRPDAVLFGAQAVNAYTDTPRMTADVDVLTTDADALAEQLRAHLADTFHIAVRVREGSAPGQLRVYQLRKPKNRHLIDVRGTAVLPPFVEVEGVRVVVPVDLVVMKLTSLLARRDRPKGGTDLTDIQRLLLARPELRVASGPVDARLVELGATAAVVALWHEVLARPLEPDEDDGDGA